MGVVWSADYCCFGAVGRGEEGGDGVVEWDFEVSGYGGGGGGWVDYGDESGVWVLEDCLGMAGTDYSEADDGDGEFGS